VESPLWNPPSRLWALGNKSGNQVESSSALIKKTGDFPEAQFGILKTPSTLCALWALVNLQTFEVLSVEVLVIKSKTHILPPGLAIQFGLFFWALRIVMTSSESVSEVRCLALSGEEPLQSLNP